MSYDLYFYKKKETTINKTEIVDYLTSNLGLDAEHDNQWIFENKDTLVYFSFEYFEKEDGEDLDLNEGFEKFDDTNFSFNINFMRPSFFGLEAFEFIDKFLSELNLFVVNPQKDLEEPYKPSKEELFENWNNTNLAASVDHFKDLECVYIPEAKSTQVWKYNFNRKALQKKLGEDYFVPRQFFFKGKKDNEVFTLSSWLEHMPTIIPPSDFFLL